MIPKQGAALIRAHRERWEDARREREPRRQVVRASLPYRLTPNAPWEPDPGDARMERRTLSRVHGGYTVWERRRLA